MKVQLNKKIKLFFNYFLVPVLFIWLGINLYSQLTTQSNKAAAWQSIKAAFTGTNSLFIILACALMFVNWGIEAIKWKLVMQPLQPISFTTAYKAVFTGTSFAANTPNRVGEYFGRMIYIDEGKRLQSVPLTIASSFGQIIVTLLLGTIASGFYIFISKGSTTSTISSLWLKVFFYGSSTVSIVAVLLYFKLNWLVTILTKIPFLQPYAYFFTKVNELSNRILWQNLVLSFCRYIVFVTQYLLVLTAFGVEGSAAVQSVLLAVLFLVLTIVPSFVIIEAGIRSSVSIEIFKVVSTNTAGIFATSTFIWLINLMLPAIIGVLLLVGKKVFRR